MVTITPLSSNLNSTHQEYDSSQEVLIPFVDSYSELNPTTDSVVISIESPTNQLLIAKTIFKYSIRNTNTNDKNGRI